METYNRLPRIIALFQEQSGRCYLCKKEMRLDKWFDNTATIDHIIPKALWQECYGSVDNKENVAAACQVCNWNKGALPLEDYLKNNRKIYVKSYNIIIPKKSIFTYSGHTDTEIFKPKKQPLLIPIDLGFVYTPLEFKDYEVPPCIKKGGWQRVKKFAKWNARPRKSGKYYHKPAAG